MKAYYVSVGLALLAATSSVAAQSDQSDTKRTETSALLQKIDQGEVDWKLFLDKAHPERIADQFFIGLGVKNLQELDECIQASSRQEGESLKENRRILIALLSHAGALNKADERTGRYSKDYRHIDVIKSIEKVYEVAQSSDLTSGRAWSALLEICRGFEILCDERENASRVVWEKLKTEGCKHPIRDLLKAFLALRRATAGKPVGRELILDLVTLAVIGDPYADHGSITRSIPRSGATWLLILLLTLPEKGDTRYMLWATYTRALSHKGRPVNRLIDAVLDSLPVEPSLVPYGEEESLKNKIKRLKKLVRDIKERRGRYYNYTGDSPLFIWSKLARSTITLIEKQLEEYSEQKDKEKAREDDIFNKHLERMRPKPKKPLSGESSLPRPSSALSSASHLTLQSLGSCGSMGSFLPTPSPSSSSQKFTFESNGDSGDSLDKLMG